jgi:hypothetical protein
LRLNRFPLNSDLKYIGRRISWTKKNGEASFAIVASVDNWKRNLLFFWLLAWTASGVIVFLNYLSLPAGSDEQSKQKLLVFVWLCFWAYFEYKIAKAFIWRNSGVEKLWLKNDNLYMKRQVGTKGRVKIYEADVVKDLRIYEGESDLAKTFSRSYWVVGGETLAFDYFGKTIRFAMQLDENDAAELLKVLKNELKLARKKAS